MFRIRIALKTYRLDIMCPSPADELLAKFVEIRSI